MSKTNDTSKFDHAKLENRVLTDSELDVVSGGAQVKDPYAVIIAAALRTVAPISK